ncbi:MAG: thioredoxin fold domain-containing protein [Gammaproteobacteria bacterium]|jgi:thioredoxin-related protein
MQFHQFKKLYISWLATLFFVSGSGLVQAKDFDDSISYGNKYPEWFKELPFHDLEQAREEAFRNGKQGLMVVFGTQGCSYCEVFVKKSLGDPELSSIVKRYFDSVGLEIFDDAEMVSPNGKPLSIKQFAKKVGAEFSPTLVFYDSSGKRVLRVTGYQSPKRFKHILNYVINKHYRVETLSDYFRHASVESRNSRNKYSLKHDSLFSQPPHMLQRGHIATGQPLMVLFEKAGCAECNDFHKNVLANQGVRNTLKEFEVVRFDSTDGKTAIRMPNGRLTTPASWFKRMKFSRLPALIFFNGKGEQVLETDALVKRQRMMNSLNFVLERAYEKNWTYQRFARMKGIERNMKQRMSRN